MKENYTKKQKRKSTKMKQSGKPTITSFAKLKKSESALYNTIGQIRVYGNLRAVTPSFTWLGNDQSLTEFCNEVAAQKWILCTAEEFKNLFTGKNNGPVIWNSALVCLADIFNCLRHDEKLVAKYKFPHLQLADRFLSSKGKRIGSEVLRISLAKGIGKRNGFIIEKIIEKVRSTNRKN